MFCVSSFFRFLLTFKMWELFLPHLYFRINNFSPKISPFMRKCTKMYQNVLKYSRDRQTINGNELSRQENAIFMQDIYAKNTEVQL